MTGSIGAAGNRRKSLISVGVDWLWPYSCLHCGQPVGDAFKPERRLCWDCHKLLPWMPPGYCSRCLAPFSANVEGEGCPSCRRQPPPWMAAHASFRYADPTRSWIHDYKYRRRYDLRRPLAHLLLAKRPPWWIDGGWDALIAMPTHPRRLWSRGFDHIYLIAKVVATELELELMTDALQRKRFLKPQVGLERTQRVTNVAGSFLAPKRRRSAIEGKRILLIDDVITTGATLREATLALLEAGATKVGVWTLANAMESGDGKGNPS